MTTEEYQKAMQWRWWILGTLGTLAVSGVLSALGLGGMVTSDIWRRIRTGRVRHGFERGLEGILMEVTSDLLASSRYDLTELKLELIRWARGLHEERP